MTEVLSSQLDDREITEVQPGSLLEEALLASKHPDRKHQTGEFAVFCMTNGESRDFNSRWSEDVEFGYPEIVKLSDLKPLVGPGPDAEISEEPDEYYANVGRIEDRTLKGFQPPPFFVVQREDGSIEVIDGNHTLAALKRLGATEYWMIKVINRDSRAENTFVAC